MHHLYLGWIILKIHLNVNTLIRKLDTIMWGDEVNMINGEDIGNLYSVFHKYLISHFSKIKGLIDYLNAIVEVCNELDMPIVWKTPSGLRISQSYLETKERRFTPPPFTNRKTTISMSIVDDHLKKSKQKNAFLPNFLHSLDAATLALLYNSFTKQTCGGSMVAIHDCFLVTADNV